MRKDLAPDPVDQKLRKFIADRWWGMRRRCQEAYRGLGIEVRVTREEFARFCYANRELILTQKKPSIDRVDNLGHYSLNNMQIIELSDNVAKKRQTTTVFTDTHGVCCRCGLTKVLEDFERNNRNKNGRQSTCLECGRLKAKERTRVKNRQ